MKKIIVILIGLFLLALAAGCGDESDDTANGGSTDGDSDSDGDVEVDLSVDEDTKAEDLTEDELMDVCGDIYDAVAAGLADAQASVEDMACVILGVSMAQYSASTDSTDADLQASCAETVQSCENGDMDEYLTDYGETETMTEEEFCDGADEAVENCDATAGEIANCMVAMFTAEMSAYEAYLAQIPDCEELTADFYESADELDISDDVEMPSECDVIAEKCPEMLEDMEKKK